MAVRTLKLTTSYDGTAYGGWQRQDNSDTVQGRLEAALAEVEGRRVTVHGAGRTDAGVHALGQVASFTLVHPIETLRLARALNAKLGHKLIAEAVRSQKKRRQINATLRLSGRGTP